jgi:hypothetical protein
MPDFRFYASSLLIIYDGSLKPKKEVIIKIIDFANCVADTQDPTCLENCTYPPSMPGPDTGYLLGLSTLIDNFESILSSLRGFATESHVVPVQSLTLTQRTNLSMGLIERLPKS